MKKPTEEKLKSEGRRLSYTAKLYLGYISGATILVVTTNLIVKTKGFPNSAWFAADESAWLAFYGSLIGGFLTLFGVNQTIRFTKAEDQRLKEIEDENNQKAVDLLLVRHLWELEAGFDELSKQLHKTMKELESIHEPTVIQLEAVIAKFQEEMRKYDFITLSAKIDWQTYDTVNQLLKKLRKLYISAESDIASFKTMQQRTLVKIELETELRQIKIEVDQFDDLFETKRSELEAAHIQK